jgi:hypothetical protein
VRIAGDVALLKGSLKELLEAEERRRDGLRPRVHPRTRTASRRRADLRASAGS